MKPREEKTILFPHIRIRPDKCKADGCNEELIDSDGYCEQHQEFGVEDK